MKSFSVIEKFPAYISSSASPSLVSSSDDDVIESGINPSDIRRVGFSVVTCRSSVSLNSMSLAVDDVR